MFDARVTPIERGRGMVPLYTVFFRDRSFSTVCYRFLAFPTKHRLRYILSYTRDRVASRCHRGERMHRDPDKLMLLLRILADLPTIAWPKVPTYYREDIVNTASDWEIHINTQLVWK